MSPPTLCQCGQWTLPLIAGISSLRPVLLSLTSAPLSWTLSLTLWVPDPLSLVPDPSPRVLFQPRPRLPLYASPVLPAPQTWSRPGLGGEAADPVCPGRV